MTGRRQIRLRTKLLGILFVPILGVAYFATTGVVERARLAGEHAELQALARLAVSISNLVHETQKERGATSGFLGAEGDAFGDRLAEQRELTDARADDLRAYLSEVDLAFDGALGERLDSALAALARVEAMRTRVDALTVATNEAIGYYTDVNSDFLDSIATMATVSSNGKLVTMTTAYVSFLMAKERMGIERAVLSNTFAADAFGPGMLTRYVELLAAQDTYLDTFRRFADERQRGYLTSVLDAAASLEVARLEALALEQGATGGFGVVATHWFDTMTDKINLMKGVEDRLSSDLVTESRSITTRSRTELIWYAASAAAIILLTVVVAIAFVRGILRQLGAEPNEMVEIAERLSEGDLRIADETTNRGAVTGVYRSLLGLVDSLGRKGAVLEQIAHRDLSVAIELASERDGLGDSLRRMQRALNEVLHEVHETVAQVSAGADQVAQASSHLSEGATEQASSLQEISASVHEISGRSRGTTESALQANTLAREASESAKTGDLAMTELRGAMDEISRSSEEISTVVKVIDDIAFQINLLALNANVEAARAGKYGRGFAVVADEVRNLAARSATAVQETRTMVDRAVASAADGTRLTEHTSERFARILDGTSRVAAMLDEIASASQEELTAIEQITEGLDQVDQVTQANTASAEESAAASEELSEQARALERMVGRFTLASAADRQSDRNGRRSIATERGGERGRRIDSRLLEAGD